MISPDAYRIGCWVMIALAVVTAIALFAIVAPYGRHNRGGWGPQIPSKLGWVLMEAPAVVAFVAFYLHGEHRAELVPLVMLGLWQIHYVNRAVIYPLRTRSSGKTMPAFVAATAFGFNVFNAWLNAGWISHLADYATAWLTGPAFIIGALLFVGGLALNVWSDRILIRLRRPGERGYVVPDRGPHRLVAAPNYLGELIEWTGWAVLTWSFAGLAFALYTAANLVPRAVAHRRWYRETFPDYPAERRAIVPWVL
ncbi:MAG: DUF1295 domain-containing protein [bacterium]